MDRSFLSQPEVIRASRNFVCIRLATYESASEGQLLKRLFRTGSGQLENSVFALLSPDGKHQLTRSGRSPRMVFGDAATLAVTMEEIGAYYRGRQLTPLKPPSLANVRLGLNVAACDRVPLVVTVASSSGQLDQLQHRLAPLAVGPLAGKAVFASSLAPTTLSGLEGAQLKSGYLVIYPDPFGQTGKVVAQLPVGSSLASLTAAVNGYQPSASQDIRSHIQAGRQQGVYWKTQIPVTDPGPGGRGPRP